ncbi:MAG: hypothetical protein ACOVOR_05335 [Rhabdochlamydiaceae bacterium]
MSPKINSFPSSDLTRYYVNTDKSGSIFDFDDDEKKNSLGASDAGSAQMTAISSPSSTSLVPGFHDSELGLLREPQQKGSRSSAPISAQMINRPVARLMLWREIEEISKKMSDRGLSNNISSLMPSEDTNLSDEELKKKLSELLDFSLNALVYITDSADYSHLLSIIKLVFIQSFPQPKLVDFFSGNYTQMIEANRTYKQQETFETIRQDLGKWSIEYGKDINTHDSSSDKTIKKQEDEFKKFIEETDRTLSHLSDLKPENLIQDIGTIKKKLNHVIDWEKIGGDLATFKRDCEPSLLESGNQNTNGIEPNLDALIEIAFDSNRNLEEFKKLIEETKNKLLDLLGNNKLLESATVRNDLYDRFYRQFVHPTEPTINRPMIKTSLREAKDHLEEFQQLLKIDRFDAYNKQFKERDDYNKKVDNHILKILGQEYLKTSERLSKEMHKYHPDLASLAIHAHLLLHIKGPSSQKFLYRWNDFRKEYGIVSKIDLRHIEDYLDEKICSADLSIQSELKKEFPDVCEQVRDYFDKTDTSCCTREKVSSCCNLRPWWNGKPMSVKDGMFFWWG